MNRFENFRDGGWFIRGRWLTVILSLAFVVTVGYGAAGLYFNSSYKTFFEADNPERQAYEHIQDRFLKSDNVLFVLTAPDGDIYRPEFLQAVHWLTDRAWGLHRATRVDSITNFQHVVADGDDLLVADLVDVGADLTPELQQEIRRVAESDPLLLGRLTRLGGNTTGVHVTLKLDDSVPDDATRAGEAAHRMAEEFRAKFPDIELRLTGDTMMSHAFAASSQADAEHIIPIMYLVIILIAWIALRSIWMTLITVLIVVLSSVAMLGVAGFAGFYFTSVSAIAPTIVLTLAVADSVHILKTVRHLMQQGQDRLSAIRGSMTVNQKPVFLTSVTTIIGFLGLNASAVPTYHDLGNMTAIGVAFAWAFSVITLPALAAITPFRVKPVQAAASGQMRPGIYAALSGFAAGHSGKVLMVLAVLAVGSVALLPQMKAYDEPIKYFGQSIEFRRDTDFTIANLTGVETIELSLPAKSGTIADPAYLADIDGLAGFLRDQPGVVHVATLSDTMKRLNRSMNGDRPGTYRLPESRELAAQYLLLYELSLPQGLDLGNTVDLDKSASRMVVTFGITNSDQIIETAERARHWLQENADATIEPSAISSASLMFAHISRANITGMVNGTGITFGLITLTIALAMMSLKYGLLSVISNVLPSVMAFGIWALVVAKIDIAVAVAATCTIGIVVDFTVHFLAKFHLMRPGRSVTEALTRALDLVGPPILSTAMILACGFSILALSDFRLNWVLGTLSAAMIVLGVVLVFIAVPAALVRLQRRDAAVAAADASL